MPVQHAVFQPSVGAKVVIKEEEQPVSCHSHRYARTAIGPSSCAMTATL